MTTRGKSFSKFSILTNFNTMVELIQIQIWCLLIYQTLNLSEF